MGGALVSCSDQFGVKVLIDEYERIKVYSSIKNDSSSPEPFCNNDNALYERLRELYNITVKESETDLSECKIPSVIIFKYSLLNVSEKEAFTHNVVSAILKKQQNFHNSKAKSKPSDYSKSFGGTEDDSKNEKEAANILRGVNVNDDIDNVPFIIVPLITNIFEQSELRRVGQWSRFLGAEGCYMYVHNLTKEVVSIRPDAYEEKDVEVANVEAEERDPANGVNRISLSDLPKEVDRIVNELHSTPLVIDCSAGQAVRSFYEYKGALADLSCLTVPFGKSGVKREEVMERCRKKLVAAMKNGTVFVLYLGGVTIEHADLKTKLCKKDTFPKEVFINGGLKLVQADYDPKYKYLYREEDLEQGQKIVRDGFHALVITSTDPYKYEELLADCIPLGYMTPVYIDFEE
jgi:hypothetical protein